MHIGQVAKLKSDLSLFSPNLIHPEKVFFEEVMQWALSRKHKHDLHAGVKYVLKR